MESHEYDYQVDKRGGSQWILHSGSDYGTVYTSCGIIEILIQDDERFNFKTKYKIFHKGRIYVRSYKKKFSRRYAVTLAKRFIKELKGV